MAGPRNISRVAPPICARPRDDFPETEILPSPVPPRKTYLPQRNQNLSASTSNLNFLDSSKSRHFPRTPTFPRSPKTLFSTLIPRKSGFPCLFSSNEVRRRRLRPANAAPREPAESRNPVLGPPTERAGKGAKGNPSSLELAKEALGEGPRRKALRKVGRARRADAAIVAGTQDDNATQPRESIWLPASLWDSTRVTS